MAVEKQDLKLQFLGNWAKFLIEQNRVYGL